MEKADIKSRMDSIRENANRGNGMKNPNDKMCPFRDQVCNSSCKLFRANKKGFECPFQEIDSMSWSIHSFVKKMLG